MIVVNFMSGDGVRVATLDFKYLLTSDCQKKSCGQIHINFYNLPSTIPTGKLLSQKNPREEESVVASTLDSFQSMHPVTLKSHVTVVYYFISSFIYFILPCTTAPLPSPMPSVSPQCGTDCQSGKLAASANRMLLVVSTAPQSSISSKSNDAFFSSLSLSLSLSLSRNTLLWWEK